MRKAYCIAFPQTARLPDSCALLLLSLSLPLFPCFSSFTGDTHVGTAHFQTQMDLFRPQPFTFLSHHLENVFNRNLIFLVYSRLSLPSLYFNINSFAIETCVCLVTILESLPILRLEINQKDGEPTVPRLANLQFADIAKFWSDFGK